jgi:hypothetical protein
MATNLSVAMPTAMAPSTNKPQCWGRATIYYTKTQIS